MGAFAPASIEYRSAEAALDVSVSELRAHRLVSRGAQVADDLGEAANLQRSLARERIRRSGRATPIKRSDFASVRRQIFSDTWIVFLRERSRFWPAPATGSTTGTRYFGNGELCEINGAPGGIRGRTSLADANPANLAGCA